MNNEEIFKDIGLYALKLATVSAESVKEKHHQGETGLVYDGAGFLTGIVLNELLEEELSEYSFITQHTITEFSNLLVKSLNGQVLTDYELGMLYMYIFDRSTEVAIKMINGQEIDTKISVSESFGYYEPDLPEYIQLKLTKVVPNVAIIKAGIQSYMKEKGYHKDNQTVWFTHFLLTASVIAIKFAMEIDLGDDSEMRHYLNDN